ncbi:MULTISPECIES: MlaA family lipoprotein [unclassified Nitrospina]|uniref:MlaA family lipoprotein n=1 Tax=unclassified Nitrospina TaxID=2638683 RepID=UPI003F990D15
MALAALLLGPLPLHASLNKVEALPVAPALSAFQQLNEVESLPLAPPLDASKKVKAWDQERIPHAQKLLPDGEAIPPASKEKEPSGEEEALDPRLLDDAVPTGDPFSDPFGDEVYEEDPFEKKQPDIPPLSDPFEGFNRSVYTFNDTVYEYALRPVAEVYRDYVNEEFRIALRNLYNVFLAPAKFVSCVVQLKFKKAGIVLVRTVMNVPLGWGGMLDVAGQEYGIVEVDEDFSQALGYWYIPSGPYIMLPFLGPSTARDTVGTVVDSVLNPLFWLITSGTVGAGVTSGKVINETSFFIDDKKALDESAIDPYVSVRDFYHQIREKKIRE